MTMQSLPLDMLELFAASRQWLYASVDRAKRRFNLWESPISWPSSATEATAIARATPSPCPPPEDPHIPRISTPISSVSQLPTFTYMVLRPLEFSDCISDSPWFRQNLHEHELALEEAYRNTKNIEQQIRKLIACTRELSTAQKAFSKALVEFKIETVGTNQTDDERVVATCLKEFGKFINQIEDERVKILNQAEEQYLEPLKRFRTEVIGKAMNEERKKYEKESSKFYQNLEKHLHLSTQRRSDFREADANLDLQQTAFCRASLQYVAEIQSVQERMKFEFVETLSSFLYSWLSFYHVGNVIHQDFKPFLDGVQEKVHKTRESYQATKMEADKLKERMLKTHTKIAGQGSAAERPTSSTIKQGYVYLIEKSKLPKTIGRDVLGTRATKYFCVYSKETRIFTMISVNSAAKTDMKNAVGQSVSFKLNKCLRKPSDSIDKRFCFDVIAEGKSETMTFQALSEEDRNQWIEAMDGRPTVYTPGIGPTSSTYQTQLDDNGFEFVQQCFNNLEDKGIAEQGLYRNCGVTSKVQKLMQVGLEKRKAGERLLIDEKEWETKTISSAVKTFLRNLPEPLMTFELHNNFINAAKWDDSRTRLEHIHYYVHKLPAEHMRMLEMVIRHLRKVADRSEENLMTVGNLGVCFGPTLLRPKEETMAAIIDIKFCNVVVEVLITNYDLVFHTDPPKTLGYPACPPKPDHRTTTASAFDAPSSNHSHISSSSSSSIQPPPRSLDKLSSGGLISRPRVSTHPTHSVSHGFSYPHTSSSSSLAQQEQDLNTRPGGVGSSSEGNSTSATTTPTRVRGGSAYNGRGEDKSGRVESADSLNSSGSGGSDTLIPAIDEPHGLTTTDSHQSSSTSKLSTTSFAPPYNSYTGETFHRVHALPAKSVISTCSLTLSSTHPRPSPRFTSSSALLHSNVPSLQASQRCRTLYHCTSDHPSELSFTANQIITNVQQSKEDGWLLGTLNGKTGLIPANYVEMLP